MPELKNGFMSPTDLKSFLPPLTDLRAISVIMVLLLSMSYLTPGPDLG